MPGFPTIVGCFALKQFLDFSYPLVVSSNTNPGKSTTLNTLLGREVAETREGRTGGAIGKFFIVSDKVYEELTSPRANKRKDSSEDSDTANESDCDSKAIASGSDTNSKVRKTGDESGVNVDDSSRMDDTASVGIGGDDPVQEILEQSKMANEESRTAGTAPVQEVLLRCPPEFGELQKGTHLVVYDMPGLNDVDLAVQNEQMVNELWPTWDYAVVVVDATQAVDTIESMKPAEMAKQLQDTIRKIPIIINLNKVDEPVRDKKKVVAILERFKKMGLSDMVIPTSSQFALLYRNHKKSKNLEEFSERCKTFDDAKGGVLDTFGNSEVGEYKWMLQETREDKLKAIYKELSDEGLLQFKLDSTNFEAFVNAIRDRSGTEKARNKLFKLQLDFEMASIGGANLVESILACYEKYGVLGQDTEDLKDFFWIKFSDFEGKVFARVNGNTDVKELEVLVDTLEAYHHFITKEAHGWEDQVNRIVSSFVTIIERQIKLALDSEMNYRKNHVNTGSVGWKSLSHVCWIHLFQSFLSCESSEHFTKYFSKYAMVIKNRITYIQRSLDEPSAEKASLWDSTFVPESISDPSHWGCLCWKFCTFMKRKQVEKYG